MDRPIAAAGAILMAMALLAALDNTVPLIARDTGLWQFHLTRAVLALAVLGAMGAAGLVRLRANRRWAVAVRGGFTAMAMLIYFGCLAFLPIGQVAAGLFSAPLWILTFSAVALGRRPRVLTIVAALIGFAGVLIVLDPLRDGLRFISLAPLGAGFFYAIGGIATREWCLGESAFSMLAWFFASLGVFGAAGLFALSIWSHPVPVGTDGFILRGLSWPGPVSWALIVTQALGSIIGVGLIMRGYQLGEAGFVSVLEYTLIVFAAFWSWLYYGRGVTGTEMAGIVIILASGALSAVASRRRPG